jgi:N-acetylglucosaminyl-diphospho-decaprenol L-rhamnosyltransferase
VPDLAVVLVAYNSAAWLEGCLESVYARAGTATLEVVVVDNGSSDGSADLVEQRFPDADVIRAPNRGFAAGNNIGVLATNAPFVLFLNADTRILEGTLGGLLDVLRARPEVGIAGCRQLTPGGEVYPTIRRFPTAARLLFEALGSEQLPVRARWLGERELASEAYEREAACDWTSGSFMLARRDALLAAGLMDERFFIYCEEPDLCVRVKQAGFEIRHLPQLTIVHHAGKEGFSPRLVAQDAFARRQYLDKHLPPVNRRIALGAFALGHALRAVLGGRRAELRPAQRAASRAALRTLAGLAPPPFGVPPARAVGAGADQTRSRPIPKQPPGAWRNSSASCEARSSLQ